VRRSLLLFALSAAIAPAVIAPAAALAQSSQLSVSGLGIPGRGLSVRSWALGGSAAIFDGESSLNPAALASVPMTTATLTSVEDFRSIESPAGDASTRSVLFPQFAVAGGFRDRPIFLGVNYSSYMVRDYTFGLVDTIVLRDAPVEVGDTFSSRGGLGDIQFGVGYRLGTKWSAGVGVHFITGSNRLTVGRGFGDSSYVGTSQRVETSYSGAGISVGVMGQLARSLGFAAVARTDGHLNVHRGDVDDGSVDLPYSFAAGLGWQPMPKLQLNSQVRASTWSGANSDLLARGEAGAKNTIEASFGGEFVSDPRRPYRRPIRFGVRYATLPFLFGDAANDQPHEVSVSIGSGTRFAEGRAGFDLALERLSRSAGSFSERAWLLVAGVTVRP